ncbi:MAG: SCO family protein [Alphaproteobacteria bacterium]|nr:SCO family protein [Alphaproteobacteria bacterium]
MKGRACLHGLALVLAAAAPVAAGATSDDPGPPPLITDAQAALRYSQAAIGRTLAGHALRDERGRSFFLAELRGRPLVVSLIYTACTDSCPIVVQALDRAVDVGREALGRDSFAVVTIGLDAVHDTPQRMRAYAASMGVARKPGWTFASADEATVNRLARDLGFAMAPSAKGFDHIAQTSVIDATGRVYRQVYGETFDPPALVEPLKDLVFGRDAAIVSLDGLLNRVKLFCTIYNPANGRYRFDYAILVTLVVGVAALSVVGFVVARNLWRILRTSG